jgi:hypothetical protein
VLAGCSVAAAPGASSVGGSSEPAATTAASSPPPVESTVAAPSDHHRAEADGLTLTVSIDRSVVAPSEVVTFTATLENGTADPVDYSVPWCGGGFSAVVSVDLPRAPLGKTWSGIAKTFKDYVLTEAYGAGTDPPPIQPVRINVLADPCNNAGDSQAILAPGETLTTSLPWKAEIVAGVGAMAGNVPFTVSVGYDRQNEPPSHEPGTIFGLFSPIYKQLVIEGTVEVVGDGPALAGPGEVIDALLADKKYSEWLAGEPRATWTNANLFLAPGRDDGFPPTEPNWEVDLFVERNVPRHFSLAFVDPFDTSILLVQYCDVPCVE